MQEELFGLQLNEDGRNYIVQLQKKVRVVFIGSIVWSLVNLLAIVMRLSALRDVIRYTGNRNITQIIVVYSYVLLTLILLPLQSYFYFSFSNRLKAGMEEQDNWKFNDSFRLLSINASLTLISLVVSLIYTFYTFSSILHW